LARAAVSWPVPPARLWAHRTDFAISRPAVGKVRWRRNSCAGFTCASLIRTLPFGQGPTAQAHGLPRGLQPGAGPARPGGLDPARAQGQVRMVRLLAEGGTLRPKLPVFEVPRVPAVLPAGTISSGRRVTTFANLLLHRSRRCFKGLVSPAHRRVPNVQLVNGHDHPEKWLPWPSLSG
jgi:hypothetical protein